MVEGTGNNAHIKRAAIIASINNGTSNVSISADSIDMDGLISKLESKSLGVGSLHVEGEAEFLRGAYFEAGITCEETIWASGGLKVGSYGASWKSKTVVTGVTRGKSRNFVYAVNGNISNLATLVGTLVTGVSSDSIYYLGR